jgi:hypothetical protein
LIRVQEFRNSLDAELLLQKKKIIVGDLEVLGFAYVGSNGKEDETTKFFNNIFSKAISSPSEPDKIEIKSGSVKYDKIRQKYELFGKWKITNESNLYPAYVFEIYKKGAEFVGVIIYDEYKKLENKYTFENLEKEGNKYYIKGSTADEYYLFDSSKNIYMFDKRGNLADVGFKCVKIN